MSEEIEAIKESAKATQEVAKTVGKGLGTLEKMGGFVAKIIGGPLEQGVGIWEDKLKYKRAENQLNYIKKFDQKRRELGLDSSHYQSITMKVGIPLLEAASLEDNDYLLELWANLTVNSTNGESGFSLERSHIAVLEQMTELEAKILIIIYSVQQYNWGLLYKIETANLPESVEVSIETVDFASGFKDAVNGREYIEPIPPKEPKVSVQLALSNLARLRCIKLAATLGEDIFREVHPTLFGEALHDAVTLKGKQ